jgi:acyl carrier protein
MSGVSAPQVRAFIVETLAQPLRDAGMRPESVPEDLDLHTAGVIDSFGLIELVAAVEDRFGLEIDFEDLDPDEMTVLGPFSRYVEERSREARAA